MMKAFRCRICSNEEHQTISEERFVTHRSAFNCRPIGNVELCRSPYNTLSRHDAINELNQIQAEYTWLKNIHPQFFQSAFKNLHNVCTKFFQYKKGFSRFKPNHNPNQSLQCLQHCQGMTSKNQNLIRCIGTGQSESISLDAATSVAGFKDKILAFVAIRTDVMFYNNTKKEFCCGI